MFVSSRINQETLVSYHVGQSASISIPRDDKAGHGDVNNVARPITSQLIPFSNLKFFDMAPQVLKTGFLPCPTTHSYPITRPYLRCRKRRTRAVVKTARADPNVMFRTVNISLGGPPLGPVGGTGISTLPSMPRARS